MSVKPLGVRDYMITEVNLALSSTQLCGVEHCKARMRRIRNR